MRHSINLAAVAFGIVLLSGCVSVESTKAQLASGNPKQVKEANETIFREATLRSNPENERIRYIELTKDYDVLFRIFEYTYSEENIAKAVARQMDFSVKGTAARLIDDLIKYRENSHVDLFDRADESVKEELIGSILSSADEKSLVEAAKKSKDMFFEMRRPFGKKLAEITTSQELLLELLGGRHSETVVALETGDMPVALKKLTDQKLLIDLLCERAIDFDFKFMDDLIAKIDEATLCDFIRNDERFTKIFDPEHGPFTDRYNKIKTRLMTRITDNVRLVNALSESKYDSGVTDAMRNMSMRQLADVIDISKKESLKVMARKIMLKYRGKKDIEAVLPTIKDQITKDLLTAKHGIPDIQAGNSALERVFARNPMEASDIVFDWDEDIRGERVSAIKDVKFLAKLRAASKSSVAKEIKKAIYTKLLAQVEKLPKDTFDKVIAKMTAHSQKMSSDGKTCVIGNYYIGMPLLGFLALNKAQDIKAAPLEWGLDSQGKHVVVTEFVFDSKNLYKATGLEKTEVSFRLPSKLGVPPFKTGMTKVEIEKRDDLQAQLSEGFGDFSNSYNISGGKIYSRSECQRMGVALIFWNETGELVLESLK